MRLSARSSEKAAEYNRYIRSKWIALMVLALVLFAVCVLAVSVGSSGLSLWEIVKALFGQGTVKSRTIIWNLRMPRVAAGIGVGIALAMTGCVMQNVLRNPLASASTLGVTQGASFGAAFAIVQLGAGVQIGNAGAAAAIAVTNPYMVTVCAFLGGIATTAVVLGLSRIGNVTPYTMILAGVALSSLFTGATTLIQYFADDVLISTVVYWTFGSLGRAGWREIALIFLFSGLAFLYFIFNRWNYNAMESGTPTAKSLGVPVDSLILISMVVCSLISAVSVAFVGCINFIGLIAPHIVRRFVGSDYRFLLPCSALMGAVIMIAADIVSRMLVAPTVLPIGALTSFLGAPLFLYMIIKKGNIT
ncbi:MAG: iron ABC transporter permease [Treponema sp.]|jgi:iron complex transport system permease protein|nr:iron ABC transporter permease [Treponema sp.]